jgi:membrane dipeptidase
VVQVVAFSAYVKKQPEKDQALADMKKKVLAKYGVENLDDLTKEQIKEFEGAVAELDKIWPKATLGDFVDHIDYAVKRIGIDHVGISSDFGGGGGVRGWNNAAETANVTAELMRRGYSEEAIAKLWSGNLLRVMAAVEQKAHDIQKAH